jgi:hypothetical protein
MKMDEMELKLNNVFDKMYKLIEINTELECQIMDLKEHIRQLERIIPEELKNKKVVEL